MAAALCRQGSSRAGRRASRGGGICDNRGNSRLRGRDRLWGGRRRPAARAERYRGPARARAAAWGAWRGSVSTAGSWPARFLRP